MSPDDPSPSAVRAKLAAGFAWAASSRVVTQIVTWTSTVIVVRLLTPADYGLVAISGIYIGILAVISEMGIGAGLVNKKTLDEEEQDSIFWLSLFLSIFLYGIVFFSAPLLADFYNEPQLNPIMRVSGLILIIGSLKTIAMSLAMRNLMYKYQALLVMAGRISAAVVSIVLAALHFGPWALVVSVLVNHIIVTIGFLVIMKRLPELRMRFGAVRSIVIYGSQLMASRMFAFASQRFPVFVVSIVFGPVATGVYSFANQIATIPLDKVGGMFNNVAFPALSRLQDDREEFNEVFMNTQKYLLIIGFPILAMLALLAEPIVVILLTSKWQAAVPLLQILCVVGLIQISYMLLPHVVSALGDATNVLRFQMLASLLVAFAVLLGAERDLQTMVYYLLLAQPILFVIAWVFIAKKTLLGLAAILSGFMPALVSTSAMVAAIIVMTSYFPIDAAYKLVATSLFAGAIYLGVMAVTFRDDLQSLISGIKRLRNGA